LILLGGNFIPTLETNCGLSEEEEEALVDELDVLEEELDVFVVVFLLDLLFFLLREEAAFDGIDFVGTVVFLERVDRLVCLFGRDVLLRVAFRLSFVFAVGIGFFAA
tara:strand:+ start:1828 stop:2148 length:321 start_codon:yes stop_codon:yes gene_type:complete